MSETYHRFLEILLDVMGLEEHEVKPTSTFGELDIDSLGLVEMTLVAQKTFGIRIADDDLTADSTVEQAAELIDSKVAKV